MFEFSSGVLLWLKAKRLGFSYLILFGLQKQGGDGRRRKIIGNRP